MKQIQVVLAIALLFQIAYVPCFAEEFVTLKGDEVAPPKLTIGEFVEATFYTKKGKKETARGYIKSVEDNDFTIGSGLWEEKIPYSKILILKLPGPPIIIGSRVRISTPHQFTGDLESVATDTVVLKPKYGSVLAIPRLSITNLEVSRGVKSKAQLGGVMGWVGGQLIGVVVFGMLVDEDDSYEEVAKKITTTSLISVGAGILIGTYLGSKHKTEQWRKVSLDRLRIEYFPDHGRLGLSATYAF